MKSPLAIFAALFCTGCVTVYDRSVYESSPYTVVPMQHPTHNYVPVSYHPLETSEQHHLSTQTSQTGTQSNYFDSQINAPNTQSSTLELAILSTDSTLPIPTPIPHPSTPNRQKSALDRQAIRQHIKSMPAIKPSTTIRPAKWTHPSKWKGKWRLLRPNAPLLLAELLLSEV